MTCIIAIETATEACSAALLISKEGQESSYTRFQLAPREHTQLILPMLDEVLAEAQISLVEVDVIAFGRGPGAFTGLRIATGIAQGLALSVDKPTIPVSSLNAMALAAHKEISKDVNAQVHSTLVDQKIIVAIDARMGEVYWAAYQPDENGVILIGEELLSKPEQMFEKTSVLAQSNAVTLIGSGWDEYLDAFEKGTTEVKSIRHINEKFPDAAEVAELALIAFEKGEQYSTEEAQPVYLRNNVAEKSLKNT